LAEWLQKSTMLIVRIRDLFEQLIVFADWLQKCGIRTMAMEATGVDGIPLFELREARGREVGLVNAEHVRPVPGRKSDGPDCRRLRFLHSVGRLHASFRPALAICAVRTRWRHRDSLIQVASVNTHDGSTFLTEVGPNLDRFASLENFASWLGLCPKKSQRPPPAQRQYPAAFQTAGDLNSIFFILHSADVSPRPVSKRWRRRCAWRRNR